MVRGNLVFAEPLAKMVSDPLGQAPRIDKNKRRAVSFDEVGDAIIDLSPDFSGHHCFQRRTGQFNGEIKLSLVASINDRASDPIARMLGWQNTGAADQEPGHLFDWSLGSGQANALQRTLDESRQAFHA